MLQKTYQTGRPYPLGATLRDGGVNFALWSDHATEVELCLFDSEPPHGETSRIVITERTENVFHVFIPDVSAGQLYGYRVHGTYNPGKGAHFNPAKLLIDPYARAIAGKVQPCDELLPYLPVAPEITFPVKPDLRDNAHAIPKSVVIDPEFNWEGDRLIERPWTETVIYELHLAGFTKQFPNIPENIRGTYAALGSQPVIDYLLNLGVTAVELLPIHEHLDESFLLDKGLSNYWGYSTLGFFAPESGYSSSGVLGGQVAEFQYMVKNLHAAGIEVILDVVYNHTCEGGPLGPTLSFRGVDNQSYYRISAENPAYYVDYTGCGNTPDINHPRVLQLVLDSLRYWVEKMHVDGFRFDLASTLTRDPHLPNMRAGFLQAIHQDPVLSRVKLIAEPWDLGEAGYLVGNFPIIWSEWNGKYRDNLRHFWKSDPKQVPDLAYRLSGSPEFYQISGRRPYASVNFITAHDGFTLNDLVSYNDKHNEANGEENRDGDSNNASWNCGVEGPTENKKILALRSRQRRNFLTTLILSQGVPMITAGDEFARTQDGNNNIYCQDNPLGWISWEHDGTAGALLSYTQRLLKFRLAHPVFRHPKFLNGKIISNVGLKDVTWFHPGGKEMEAHDWHDPELRSLGMMLCGDAPSLRDDTGCPFHDSTYLVIFNGSHSPLRFILGGPEKGRWKLLIDTAKEIAFVEVDITKKTGNRVVLTGHSIHLYELQR